MTATVVAVLMGLWAASLIMIAGVAIFFRQGSREWHRRPRNHHGRRYATAGGAKIGRTRPE